MANDYFGVVAGALLFDELFAGGMVGVAGVVVVSGVAPGVVLGMAPGVVVAPLLSVAPGAGAAALPASPAVPLVPEVAGVAGAAAVVSVLVVSCLLQPDRAAVVSVAASTILASGESVFMADPFDG